MEQSKNLDIKWKKNDYFDHFNLISLEQKVEKKKMIILITLISPRWNRDKEKYTCL